MATQSSSKGIDLQKVISGAAELEVKALLAGVEYVQVWLGQASKLANIANDTLQAIQDDKASLSATARRLTEFGKNNAEVFSDLSSRMTKRYYSELDRLAAAVDQKSVTRTSKVAAAEVTASAKKVLRRRRVAKRRSGRKA